MKEEKGNLKVTVCTHNSPHKRVWWLPGLALISPLNTWPLTDVA